MRIAIVSGASSGMGREFVKMIDKKCHKIDEIWVIARREERLKQLQFQTRHPLRIFAKDLSKEESLYELKKMLEKKKPKISILVASAGFGKYGPNIKMPYEDAMGMVRVNVLSLTGLTQMALPYMAKGGHIILLASSAAFVPQPGFGIYAATKSYVLSYARSLNTEMKKHKVSVTAVCPGPVATEFFDECGSGKTLSALKVICMADPVKVVRLAWKDAMKRKPVSVYGCVMKFVHVATKILPHSFILKVQGILL